LLLANDLVREVIKLWKITDQNRLWRLGYFGVKCSC